MSKNAPNTRRKFIAGGSAAAFCAGCSIFTRQAEMDAEVQAAEGLITLHADAAHRLQAPLSTYRVQVPEGPRLIIIRGATGLTALSSACTHWGSDVEPNATGELECPTHGSRFSAATGAVLEGPARAPLRRYPITEDSLSGAITIQLPQNSVPT